MGEFRFKASIVKYIEIHKGQSENKRKVAICLHENSTGRDSVALPISIVTKTWPSVKLQPAYSYTSRFVRFLNYAYFESDTPITAITQITPVQVLDYFNMLSKESGRNYTRNAEDNIYQGLYFLWKKGICTGLSLSDFAFVPNRQGEAVYLIDVKNHFTLPPVKRREQLHDLDPSIVRLMFDLAIRHTPRIALGLYYQVFGGLRRSEVISLEYNRIHFNPDNHQHALYVDIADVDLRPDTKRGFLTQAKRPRKQKVIYIPAIYNTLYNLNARFTARSDTDAVFLNSYGKPMTEASYDGYFRKLKNILIEAFRNSNNPETQLYANVLSTASWSTHIGRGIYSNIIAEHAETSAQLAKARGDSSQDSALPYLCDTQKIEDQIVDTLEKLYTERPLGADHEKTN